MLGSFTRSLRIVRLELQRSREVPDRLGQLAGVCLRPTMACRSFASGWSAPVSAATCSMRLSGGGSSGHVRRGRAVLGLPRSQCLPRRHRKRLPRGRTIPPARGASEEAGADAPPIPKAADGSPAAGERDPVRAGRAQEGSQGGECEDRGGSEPAARLRRERHGLRLAHGCAVRRTRQDRSSAQQSRTVGGLSERERADLLGVLRS